MSVYLITCRALEAVKIGRSANPHKRLKQIKTGCPFPVALEAILPEDSTELQMHRRFEDGRLAGEWFKLTSEIERLIEAHPAADASPKKPEQFSWYAGAKWADAGEDLKRKIAAIRRNEAAGKIPQWVGPSANNGVNFIRGSVQSIRAGAAA